MDEVQILKRATEAINRGDQNTGSRLLAQVLQSNPRNKMAWLRLAGIIDDPCRKRECLDRVLAIDPANEEALAALAEMSKPVAPPAVQPPPVPQPKKSPWYFSGPVLALTLLFCTPLWAMLVLADRRQGRKTKIVAGVIGLIWLLWCGYITLNDPWEAALSGGNKSAWPTPTRELVSPRLSDPQLALLSTRSSLSSGGGYFTIEGEVKNISGSTLENVVAVVSTYNDDQDFITSESALIEYTTLLPSQISPFEVMVDYNPAMVRYKVVFKHLLGEAIPTRDDRSK